MAGEVGFVELGAEDAGRAQAFYGELFGWTFAPTDGGAELTIGGVPAGLHGQDRGAAPYVFFAVDDLDTAVETITRLGGSVDDALAGDPEKEARYGRFRLCTDDQGSAFGIHERPTPA